MKKLLFYILLIFLFLTTAIGFMFFMLTTRTEGQYFDSDGVSIHYTVEGNGEPVILLHGLAVNSDLNFRRPGITQELSKYFKVIAFDLRGHGLSGKPHDPDKYGLEIGYDLIRLMDHLKIKKAHIVGYSLGGFITLKLAPEYQHRFKSISLICAGWEIPDKNKLAAALTKSEKKLESGNGISPILERIDPDRPSSSLNHKFWLNLMTRCFNDKLALIAMIKSFNSFIITEQGIKSIIIPIQSIVGSKDPVIVGARNLSSTANNHKFYIIENCDHVQVTLKDETKRELISFIKNNNKIKNELSTENVNYKMIP